MVWEAFLMQIIQGFNMIVLLNFIIDHVIWIGKDKDRSLNTSVNFERKRILFS